MRDKHAEAELKKLRRKEEIARVSDTSTKQADKCPKCGWKHDWTATEGWRYGWSVRVDDGRDSITSHGKDRRDCALLGHQLAQRLCLRRQLSQANKRIGELEKNKRGLHWERWSESCPLCGDDAEVLTTSDQAGLVYDGDEARCVSCRCPGGVTVTEESTYIAWHDEPGCTCEWCKLSCAQVRMEELEAVVDEYPKTADGIRIVRGMKVYAFDPGGDYLQGYDVHGMSLYDDSSYPSRSYIPFVSCYSSREAAEQAREESQ